MLLYIDFNLTGDGIDRALDSFYWNLDHKTIFLYDLVQYFKLILHNIVYISKETLVDLHILYILFQHYN